MSWTDIEKGTKENSDRTPITKFEAGATTVRILDEEPYSFWNHWLQKQQTGVTCPGKGCPICNIIAQQKANKEKPMYSSTQRHAMRIWNYKTNQMEIMIQGTRFFSNLLTLHKEIGDIRTYDIKVVRSGEGKDTTYALLPCQPAEFAITEGIEDINFKEYFVPPTNEEIIQLIEGKSWNEIRGEKEAVA